MSWQNSVHSQGGFCTLECTSNSTLQPLQNKLTAQLSSLLQQKLDKLANTAQHQASRTLVFAGLEASSWGLNLEHATAAGDWQGGLHHQSARCQL